MVNRLFTLTLSILLIGSKSCQLIDLSLTDIADHINALESGWTAAVDQEFDLADDDALRKRLGGATDAPGNNNGNSVPLVSLNLGGNRLLAGGSYPASLDLRSKYPACKSISYVRDQGQCGSCWAFSSMNSLSDRFCIANYNSGNPTQRSFSPQDSLECCANCPSTSGAPCKGGYIAKAFAFAKSTGVSTGEEYGNTHQCKPYFMAGNFSGSYSEPACKKSCANSANYKTALAQDRFKIKGYNVGTGEQAMIAALNNGGSLAVTFTVYKDFYAYKSGIYSHVTGADLGLHAVRVVGYGVANGTKYWLAANSWNSSWGESGFFRIRRGTNECGIETNQFAYGVIY